MTIMAAISKYGTTSYKKSDSLRRLYLRIL